MGCPNNRYIDNHKCNDGWISVNDKLPVGGMVVQCKVDDGVRKPYECLGYMVVNWLERQWYIKDGVGSRYVDSNTKITHWKEYRSYK